MFRNINRALTCCLAALLFVTGCKPKPADETSPGPATEPASPPGYFQTSFQTESQFIVEAIVSDLAEQLFYQAFHRLPDPKNFLVVATEKPGSPADAPVYELQVRLDPKVKDLNLELNVNGPIWSPAVYQTVVSQLAGAVRLPAGHADNSGATPLLPKLTDGTAETIEQEDQRLSAALEKDFGNPVWHEEAAALLGAFLLRDHSKNFFEIRTPLCRMTAHLAMARFLSGSDSYGINGRMAEAMLLTLVGDEAPALEHLNAIGTNDAALAPMVRALMTRNTGDFRLLGDGSSLSRFEAVERFSAMAFQVSPAIAWNKLSDAQKQTVDFVRAANQEGFSVEMGHQLLAVSLPLELQEIQRVYGLTHQDKLSRDTLVKALNELPERCFVTEPGGDVHVRVIGWGQWALFLQRHLCHAVSQNFDFMNRMWGVPDDARSFAIQCDQAFSGLRLYPFVRRFTCTDVESYHSAVDDAFKVTVATPQLVPAECWNYLCYRVHFAPLYDPNPNPHINEWHNHNPPPGTVYDVYPRLDHPSLTSRPDAAARIEKLREWAPYEWHIVNYLLEQEYHDHPTYDQAMTLFGPVLPYSTFALETIADTVKDQPEQYEKYMLQAAELDPSAYYQLSDYALGLKDEDKAAQYIEKACAADPDAVSVASQAEWRVRYYLKKGQTDKAAQIADEAGEVYSDAGLTAKAVFMELTTNYDGAFQWYAKIEERYNDSVPLILFCQRHKALTGDNRFEPDLQKRMQKLFPNGVQKVSLADFHGPPVEGVSILHSSDLLLAAGLKSGDVIAALNGTRTDTYLQYGYVRRSLTGPEMDLIVWQDGAYHEVTASPPDHKFGVDLGDYSPR